MTVRWLLFSFLFAISFLSWASAAQEERPEATLGQCWTEEGFAHWSGICQAGKAQGQGIATYRDSHLRTIEGVFKAGAPEGVVSVVYYDGQTYERGYLDGEPHGFGIIREASGEGFEGNWVRGIQDGEGIYTNSDGEKFQAKWEGGRFLGSWMEANKDKCLLWWAGGSEPSGTLSWDGACEKGKAKGNGIVRWSGVPNSTPRKHTIVFEGVVEDGKLNGRGQWREVRVYTNVTYQIVRSGTWLDGQMSGEGKYTNRGDFTDSGNSDYVKDSYLGSFKDGQYSGRGTKTKLKMYDDEQREFFLEEGVFERGSLNGQGKKSRLRQMEPGELSVVETQGTHKNGQFIGPGKMISRVNNSEGIFSELVTFPSLKKSGGVGETIYPNGDRFSGEFSNDFMGSSFAPKIGQCDFESVDYSGPCRIIEFERQELSGKFCLVDPDDIGTCLRVVSSWVS